MPINIDQVDGTSVTNPLPVSANVTFPSNQNVTITGPVDGLGYI